MKYKTGETYKEFMLKSETSVMKFDGKRACIFILRKNPDDYFLETVKTKLPFFQIYSKNNIIFLLVKFGELDWIDVPYINEGSKPDEIPDDTFGYPCSIFFAEITNGRLLQKRYVCFSNGLSKAFYYAVKEQEKHLPKNILHKINSIRASFHPNEIARLSLGK